LRIRRDDALVHLDGPLAVPPDVIGEGERLPEALIIRILEQQILQYTLGFSRPVGGDQGEGEVEECFPVFFVDADRFLKQEYGLVVIAQIVVCIA